jgi:hypothetical protein
MPMADQEWWVNASGVRVSSSAADRERVLSPYGCEVSEGFYETYPPASVPTIVSLTPNTAVVGGPDLEMTVTGTGFDESSVIDFNGSDERTTYISPTSVSTTVKPSLASGASTVNIKVRSGEYGYSNALPFTFTVT